MGDRVTRALLVVVLATCGRGEASHDRSPLEEAIDTDLGVRFGVGVVTHCLGYAPACATRLPDGTTLPISLSRRGKEWRWRVIGLVITTDRIEEYLRDEVADLGAPQNVRCAPRIRRIDPGDQIECWLQRGGKAFVIVRADGTTSVEVELDATAANARSELITPKRDKELSTTSRSLEYSASFDDDEEALPADAGGQPPR